MAVPTQAELERTAKNMAAVNRAAETTDPDEVIEADNGRLLTPWVKIEALAADQVAEVNAARDEVVAAADAVQYAANTWPTDAAGVGQGVKGYASLVGGSGGTNGTFALAYSGGTQVIAPKGRFVVAGGALVQILLDYSGHYSAGSPTFSFAASAGLSGASATVVMGPNTPDGGYFNLISSDAEQSTLLRRNVGGVATAAKSLPSAQAVTNTRIDDKSYASQRNETFKEIGRFPVARSDATAATGFAGTYHSSGGLDIVSNQGSPHVVVGTDFSAWGYGQRWSITATSITITAGTAMIGLALGAAGTSRRQYLYRTDGRVYVVKDNYDLDYDIAPASAGRAYTTGSTVKLSLERKVDGSGKLTITMPSGETQSFAVTDLPMGAVWLAFRGNANMYVSQFFGETTNPLTEEKLAELALPELSTDERASLYVMSQYLAMLEVKRPAGFTGMVANLRSYRMPGGKFIVNIDFEAMRPFKASEASATIFVDGVSGSDSNAGTETSPLKGLRAAAHGRSGKVHILAKPGMYADTLSWNDANSTAAMLMVEPWGEGLVISSNHKTGLVWSLAAGKEKTYQASIASVGWVIDDDVVDEHGDSSRTRRQTSIDAVELNLGSWYFSSGLVYVSTHDGRAPDADIRVFPDTRNGAYLQPDGVIWMKKFAMDGGSRPMQLSCTDPTKGNTGFFWGCKFRYSGGSSGRNGYHVDGGCFSFLRECYASQTELDGFGYHKVTGSAGPVFVEIDCVARNNGDATSANDAPIKNASSGHDGSVGFRSGGLYEGALNRVIHDVGGSKTWNMGCTARNSRGPDSSVNWAAGSAVDDGTEMWLDSCISEGSTYDYETQSSTIRRYNATDTNRLVPGSSVSAYTP